MREFRYLNPGLNRDPDDVLSELDCDEVVIRDENTNRFIVLEKSELFDFIESAPPQSRNYHEVIFGDTPQKLKFDVDMPTAITRSAEIARTLDVFGVSYDPLEIQTMRARAILDRLLDAIRDAFCAIYYPANSALLADEDIVICDSSGYKIPRGVAGGTTSPLYGEGTTSPLYKFSYHVVIDNYCVANNREAKHFTGRVLELCDNGTRKYVDTQVNSAVQNFRIVGCSKVGSDRAKKVVSGHPPDSAMITFVDGCQMLKAVAPTVKNEVVSYSDDLYRKVIDACQDVGMTVGHVFRCAKGSMLFFDRVKPSYCGMCGETHHKDNTLMVNVREADGVFTAAELCRHFRRRDGEDINIRRGRIVAIDTEDVTIRDVVKRTKTEMMKKLVTQVANPLQPTPPADFDELFDRGKDVPRLRYNIYEERYMRAYEHVPTMIVKAAMGVGKTKALIDYVKSYFSDGMEKKYIRFVTFRRTFSRAIKEAFPDFTMYSSVRGPIVHNECMRLIVQVESLHRINLESSPEKVDLLILDEVESVLEQFSSKLHRNISASFAVFEWMVRYARHVICMDANVGRRTIRMLQNLRGNLPPVFHWNKWRQSSDYTFVFTADKNCWFGHMVADLRAGKRVVVPTNSLKIAESVEDTLRAEFPDKVIQLYSSRTDQMEKNDHFGRVGEIWGGFDVMIYTPTVSAGISFEEVHFDVIYASFTSLSCNVETCRQMLGRVRSIGDRRVVVHIDARKQFLPTEFAEIRRFLVNRRDILYTDILSPQVPFSYDEDGQARYQESAFFNMWVETMCLDHLSKNDFTGRFVKQVADTGAKVEFLADQGVAYPLEKSSKHMAAVAAANDVTDEEYDELRRRYEEGGLGYRDIVQLDKYRIRETYYWWDREIDLKFVETYSNPAVVRIFRNLNRIMGNASFYEAVAEIQGVDLNRSEMIGMDDTKLLTSRMVYHQHYYSFMFLMICGFSHVFDRQEHFHTFVVERLYAARSFFLDHYHVFGTEFGVNVPLRIIQDEKDKRKFSKTIIRIMNKILGIMYGIRVRWSQRFKKGLILALNTDKIEQLFSFWEPPAGRADSAGRPWANPFPRIACGVVPSVNSAATTFIELIADD